MSVNLQCRGREADQEVARRLVLAARNLLEAVDLVETLGDNLWDVVAKNEEAADSVVVVGPDVARAMKTLALHLDRCAMDHWDEANSAASA